MRLCIVYLYSWTFRVVAPRADDDSSVTDDTMHAVIFFTAATACATSAPSLI